MTHPVLPHASVPEWVEHQVRLAPDAAAVSFEEASLTYKELNGHANQLARRLIQLGIGPGKIVALCLDRSLDLVVVLLGILKSGGAYLPIDPTLPKERQALMLKDAQPSLVLTQQGLLDSLPALSLPIFNLDVERAGLAAENPDDLDARVGADDLAYVMYTSGSTGTPKGVEIAHRPLVNFLASMKERPGLTDRDVLVAITTYSFDIAGLEIFLPLVTGARVILVSTDDAADGFRLIHHITANDATVLQGTPATWRMLLDAKWAGSPCLKMLCGGEALPRDLANQLLAKGGELWNMYGPTETTIWSSAARVLPDDAPIHIGQPIANTQLYVLDPHLQPVPMGVNGELHIGGVGLARGYRNRAELTAERFIPDPFSDEPVARLYKTGDVARMRTKGQIEILGRLDHQVKIRGFRIELGEIEACISEHPQVREVVVVGREDVPGRKQLIAYVVPRNGAPVAGASPGMGPLIPELRGFLEPKLPDYMIPAFFEELSALPRTPNGKINRRALPTPHTQSTLPNRPYVAPRDPLEVKLTEIWGQVLGRDRVGIEDNIFEIGGDSLLIFRIAVRAKEAGLPITVRHFFQHRTIAGVVAGMETANPSPSSEAPLPVITAVSRAAFRRPQPVPDAAAPPR
jgi:amino acid adenylation domain-containing protein